MAHMRPIKKEPLGNPSERQGKEFGKPEARAGDIISQRAPQQELRISIRTTATTLDHSPVRDPAHSVAA